VRQPLQTQHKQRNRQQVRQIDNRRAHQWELYLFFCSQPQPIFHSWKRFGVLYVS
jgi:hypothetical protein